MKRDKKRVLNRDYFGPPPKKYDRDLGKKGLEKVWEWAELNEGDPLGETYLAACFAVGEFDPDVIANRLKRVWDDGWDLIPEQIFMNLLRARDNIGLVILDVMRREARLKK